MGVSISLRSCGLRGGSAPTLAVFIESHPKLRHIDLSRNSLSYSAGELLLEALQRRADASSGKQISRRQTFMECRPLHDITIDLGGTWFNWDRTDRYMTVGPPCGNIWAGLKDSRAKLAPSSWIQLRENLEKTNSVRYSQSSLPVGKQKKKLLAVDEQNGEQVAMRRTSTRPRQEDRQCLPQVLSAKTGPKNGPSLTP